MPDPFRIMVVDDHYLVRVGLSSIITLEGDMTVCAEAATGEQAVTMFRAQQPDVTLMDLRLPGMSGIEATQAILGEFPEARIIVLSTYAADEEIYVALQAGAIGYLLKTVQPEELILTIRKAISGSVTSRRKSPPGSRRDRHARIFPHASSRSCASSSGAGATKRLHPRWTSPKEP
jgi:DNA-binding NarL/FixJ family response regulator